MCRTHLLPLRGVARLWWRTLALCLCLGCWVPGHARSAEAVPSWPQFRGPGGLAIAKEGHPPIHFGPGSNVVWKVALPQGHSSPCVWGSRIFLTGLNEGKLETLCVDRSDGHVVWRRPAPAAKVEPTHRIGSPAASTPATDGRRVFVYFGSFGLVAYDLEGSEEWRQPLPTPMVEFGAATSPVLAGNLVVLAQDQDQGAYLLAVRAQTGQIAWRTERPEFRRSFSSPFVWHHEDGAADEIVLPGSIWLRSYRVSDGQELWSYTGTSRVANSTPTAGDGLLFSSSWNVGADPGDRIRLDPWEDFARANDRNQDGRLSREEVPEGPVRERFTQMDLNKDGFTTAEEWRLMSEMFDKAGNAVLAIRPGGRGDVTTTHLAWRSTRSLPYVCSPVYSRGRLYTVKNGGLASCYEAKSGRMLYQDERLDAPGDFYASLIAAGGRVYAISQRGRVVVMEEGATLRVLARNDLAEEVMATPAVVEGRLFVRTAGHLYAFGL